MNSCPNCGRRLGYPLSDCQGGRCPFCGYKPGDHDEHVRERGKPRVPRDVPRYRPGDNPYGPAVFHDPPPEPYREPPWWLKPLYWIMGINPRGLTREEEIEEAVQKRIAQQNPIDALRKAILEPEPRKARQNREKE